MGTPRVPDSNVVEIHAECPSCERSFTVEAHTPWMELRELNGYVFKHSPKWKGVAVAILPFRRVTNAWNHTTLEFLGVWEQRPCWGGEKYFCSITGAYDNSGKYTLEQCALNELEEEGGYSGWDRPVINLGWVNGGKDSDSIDHLFAVEITAEDEQVAPKGDGSVHEQGVVPEWLDEIQVIHSRDMLMLSAYARLKHLITASGNIDALLNAARMSK